MTKNSEQEKSVISTNKMKMLPNQNQEQLPYEYHQEKSLESFNVNVQDIPSNIVKSLLQNESEILLTSKLVQLEHGKDQAVSERK